MLVEQQLLFLLFLHYYGGKLPGGGETKGKGEEEGTPYSGQSHVSNTNYYAVYKKIFVNSKYTRKDVFAGPTSAAEEHDC